MLTEVKTFQQEGWEYWWIMDFMGKNTSMIKYSRRIWLLEKKSLELLQKMQEN
jgi:LAS superfamily LD-carboxypeptidase LdcB